MSCFRHLLIAAVVPLVLIASPALGVPWHLDVIDQRMPPLDNVYSPRGTGSGYTVWIISTGIDATLPEFEGRAQQVINYGGANEDTIGLGTWLASLVGGNQYGVATAVQLRGVKVTDECGRTTVDAIENGINYVIANGGSNSIALVGFAFDTFTEEEGMRLDNAVANLVAAGVPTAVPAGDVAIDACQFSPARERMAVTVGAHGRWSMTEGTCLPRTSWSAYGSCVDIYAPGEDITAAWPFGEGTRTLDTTAGSAAIFAGGLALYGGSTSLLIMNAPYSDLCGYLRLYVG